MERVGDVTKADTFICQRKGRRIFSPTLVN